MPGGRPSKIDQVVVDDGERVVTASERILQVLRLGAYFEQAAAAAGIDKVTAYGWLRVGADATARRHRNPDVELTGHEERCAEFSHAVALAEAEWEALALGQLEQLARGGIVQEVTTVKVAAGKDGAEEVLERSTRTTRTLPDARVLMWRLERRFPARYGHKVDITSGGEVLGAAGVDRAAELAAQASEHLATVTKVSDAPSARSGRRAPAKKAAGKTTTSGKAPAKRPAGGATAAPRRRRSTG